MNKTFLRDGTDHRTIPGILERRRLLEEKIRDEVELFEASTGMEVSSISIERRDIHMYTFANLKWRVW